jgi:hypothetical protein
MNTPSLPTCSFVITRGKNAGNPCGRRLINDSINDSQTFCKDHVPKLPTEKGCVFVLTRGNRKGETCNHVVHNDNTTFCYAHDQNIEFKKCPFLLNKGARKGQTCDRRRKASEHFCSMHKSVQTQNTQNKWKPSLETIFEEQILLVK